MSQILEALKRTGARLSSEATVSVKDDAGVKVGRINVGTTLSLAEALDPVAVVKAVAASTSGGSATFGNVSDKLDNVGCAVAVNAVFGAPVDEDTAIEIAATASMRDKIRTATEDYNRAQTELRAKTVANAQQRLASRQAIEASAHVENVAELAEELQTA